MIDAGFAFDLRVTRKRDSPMVELGCTPALSGQQCITALALAVVLVCKRERLEPEILWESMRSAIVDGCAEMRGRGEGVRHE